MYFVNTCEQTYVEISAPSQLKSSVKNGCDSTEQNFGGGGGALVYKLK
jgi:hypothetical protein